MALAREESSPLFAGSVAGTLRLIMYLALAVVLMVLDHRNGWIWRLRYATSAVIEPLYRLAGMPSRGFHDLSVAFADRALLTTQNQQLRQDLLLANAKLNRMAAVAEQNQRLQALLDTQHSLDLKVQLAHVIDVDFGAYRHRLMIGIGARDGVKVGQPVIDAHGLIGQVVDVLPTTAWVMLVTDPNHAVPVTIERTGLRTIAYGSRGGEQLSLPMIPLDADVHVGDRLLTSGLGGRFPGGFPVGSIRSIGMAANGLFREAYAQPAAEIDRSDDVLLLRDQAEPVGPPAPAPPVGPPADLAPVSSGSVSVAPRAKSVSVQAHAPASPIGAPRAPAAAASGAKAGGA